MCPPRFERRPIPWEGSFNARDCHEPRADSAVELYSAAALCLGDGWVSVDRAVPGPCVRLRPPGRELLEARRHRRSVAAAGGRVRRRHLGHDGVPLHHSVPPGTIGDAPAIGGAGWWDALRMVWFYWAGLARFLVVLVGWGWGLIKL